MQKSRPKWQKCQEESLAPGSIRLPFLFTARKSKKHKLNIPRCAEDGPEPNGSMFFSFETIPGPPESPKPNDHDFLSA